MAWVVRGLREYATQRYRVTLTQDQARRYRQAFFRTYPGLYRWHRRTGAQLKRTETLETRTLSGRRQQSVSSFTLALNSPVQGSGADGLKIALARLFEHRTEVPEARLIATIHDEIVAECPVEDAEATVEWLRHHMVGAMEEIMGEAVPIDVETTIGRDWAGTPLD